MKVMKTKQTTFDRFHADIERGDVPRDEDKEELERRAAALHNSYPQKIDALHAELKSDKTLLETARAVLEVATEAIVQAVVMARTPEGKPLYSNESLRAIEIKKRIAANANCAIVSNEVTQLEERHNINVVLLQRAQNDYAAWKDLIRVELAARSES